MNELTKVCSKCKVEKPISGFHKNKSNKYGVSSRCKVCTKEYGKQYHLDNSEKHKKKGKQYYLDNPDYMKQWRLDNPEKVKKQKEKYSLNNHAKLLELGKQWRLNNPDYSKQYRLDNYAESLEREKQYRLNNPEKVKKNQKRWDLDNAEQRKEYRKRRYHEDPQFKIMAILRTRLVQSLKGNSKSASTVELLGCTSVEFKDHLESQFTEGMTWDNHGTHGWHMDHIRPCASFDLKDPIQQQECFHWTNFQPLWAADNWSKGDKYE